MADRSPSFITPRRDSLLACGLFALVTSAVWLVYGGRVDAPLVYDDQFSITENPSITRLWPLVGDSQQRGPFNPPPDIPTTGRPLVNLSFAFNYQIGGLNPRGYHLVNILLHILSATLLGAIVRRTLQTNYFRGQLDQVAWPLAVLVALVWALHPLQTEAVIYISQRTELLMGFCYLATLYASIRYWSTASSDTRVAWLTLAALACLAGMASKEVMVSAPLVVLLYERTFITGSLGTALRRSAPLYTALALSWLLLVWLNFDSPRAAAAGFHHGVPAYVWWFTQAKVLLMYFKLAVWPWPLLIHYATQPLDTFATAWLWLLAVSPLAIGTLVLSWRNTASGFLGACVWLILSPTLIVPVLTEYAAERRMYLPLAALVALVVVGGYNLAMKTEIARAARQHRPAEYRRPLAFVAAIACLGLVALGSIGVNRLSAYQDEITLWQDALDHHADDFVVHRNLGMSLLEAGRLDDAMQHLTKTIQLQPDDADQFYNLGVSLVARGRPQEAIRFFEKAVELKPDFARAHYNLGCRFLELGSTPEAIQHLEQAVKLKPDYIEAHNNLSSALRKVGRVPEAIEHLQQAIRLQPTHVEAWTNLASATAESGHPLEAITAGEEALRLARAQGRTDLTNQIDAWLTAYRGSLRSTPSTPPSPALPPAP